MNAAPYKWLGRGHADAVAYARSLMSAYRVGFGAAAMDNPRCMYANPAHRQSWEQGLVDGRRDRAAARALGAIGDAA